MVTAAKAAFELRTPHQLFLVGEDKVQHGTFSHGFLYYLEEEVVINTCQDPLQYLVHCCVTPPTDIVVVEVPHEYQCLGSQGYFQLSVECFISFLLLIRQPVVNTQNSVTHIKSAP